MEKIKLVNISKSFKGKQVLDNINFSVQQGEIMSLLGASGCGKSTTLKIIAGLIEPEFGEVYISGNNAASIPVENRGTVIVFQDNLLFPHMTVEENIGFGLKMSKKGKELIRAKVKDMVQLLGIQGMEKKYPGELSGGQKQRVAMGRALAVQPRVLLLDEPFSSLDINMRNEMRELFLVLQKKLNITTILVTHDKEEAMMLSHNIALMEGGKIIQYGTPKHIYNNPTSKAASDYFGHRNYIKGHIREGKFISNIFKFDTYNLENGSYELMIKPEHIHIENLNENNVKGTIINKKYAGDRIYYSINVENTMLNTVQSSNFEYEIGDEVAFSIDFSKNIFFKLN